MEQTAPQESQEMLALQLIMKAAEKYLATLDDVARPIMAQHLQNAVSVIVRAIAPPAPQSEKQAE